MNQPYNFSSVQGAIRYLLMEFDSTKVEKPMGRMLALQQAMPGVKFLLWCSRADIHEKVRQYLEEHSALSHSGHHYEAEVIAEDKDCIVVYENFSGVKPWIRDAFFPGKMTGNKCLLFDTVDEKGSDQGWAKRMEAMSLASGLRFKILGVSDEQAENLGIAGGDVLIDGKWVFLGKQADKLEKLIRQQQPSSEIIVLSEKAAYPELYHIDLFLTLTGNWENDRYVLLVGRCIALEPVFEEEARRLNECLDGIARRLENDYPIKVIRNPIPLNGNLFPYNNCLVAVAQGQKSVWLPAYTFDFPQHTLLQELEKETKTIWHELGFNPCLVSASFSDLLGVKAGLHCITNELRG